MTGNLNASSSAFELMPFFGYSGDLQSVNVFHKSASKAKLLLAIIY